MILILLGEATTVTTNINPYISILDDYKWPIVVIIIILIFSKPLKSLLYGRFKLKAFGTEIETGQEIQKTQETNVKEFSNLDSLWHFLQIIL